MNNMYMRTEQRQHLSLSRYAYSVIESDSCIYFGKKNISGFINIVIEKAWQTSDASISLFIENQMQQLTSGLLKQKYRSKHPEDTNLEYYSPAALTSQEKQTLYMLAENAAERKRSQQNAYPKDVTLKIRLQNNVYDILYPEDKDWPEKPFYASQSAYIKALLENYARKSHYDREAIYYKPVIEDLTSKLRVSDSNKRILLIKYQTFRGEALEFRVKPYRLSRDYEAEYHYLVGLSCNIRDADLEYTPAVFRISRIRKIQTYSQHAGSGKLTHLQREELDDDIRRKGISFLLQDTEVFEILLTSEGMNNYHFILHLRPDAKSITPVNEDPWAWKLTVTCTRYQLQLYFFQFGSSCRILSPKDAALELKNRYLEAAEQYEH